MKSFLSLKKCFEVFALMSAVAFVLALSSCTPKPKGVRAQMKTSQNNLSPNGSATATQQAASQNANYTISTLSFPIQTTQGYVFDVELQMPDGKILPVTTSHENGNLFSEGVYNDSERGNMIYFQAACTTSDCYKYLLMVTVYKSNSPVFQNFAISYSTDCKFNVMSTSAGAGGFFSNLESAERYYSNVTAANDASQCK